MKNKIITFFLILVAVNVKSNDENDTIRLDQFNIESDYYFVKSEENWKIFKTSNELIQEVKAFIPIFKNNNGTVKLENIIIAKKGKTNFSSWITVKNKKTKYIVKTDPNDPTTWYDSVDVNWKLVMRNTNYLDFFENSNFSISELSELSLLLSNGKIEENCCYYNVFSIHNEFNLINNNFNTITNITLNTNTQNEFSVISDEILFADVLVFTNPDFQVFDFYSSNGSRLSENVYFGFELSTVNDKKYLRGIIDEKNSDYYDQTLKKVKP